MRMWRDAMVIVLAVLGLAQGLAAEIVTRAVPYKHGDVELEGYLAYDSAKGDAKRPGVLVVHEWWGLNDYARMRARKLAELGYVAFAVDMYGKGMLTSDPAVAGGWASLLRGKPLLRQRAQAGLEVLAKQPQVDASRVAAIGYCFGGTTVLELAYGGAPVRGVVSFHGSPTIGYDNDVSKLKASVLFLHGSADTLVPQPAIDQMTAAWTAVKADWTMVIYADAKHSFTNPDADKLGMGPVGYQAAADRRSWEHMKVFLAEVLGDK